MTLGSHREPKFNSKYVTPKMMMTCKLCLCFIWHIERLYLNNNTFQRRRGEAGTPSLRSPRFHGGFGHAKCKILKQKPFDIFHRSHPKKFFQSLHTLRVTYLLVGGWAKAIACAYRLHNNMIIDGGCNETWINIQQNVASHLRLRRFR